MSEPRIGDVWPVLRRWRRLEALARTHCVLASILATLGAFGAQTGYLRTIGPGPLRFQGPPPPMAALPPLPVDVREPDSSMSRAGDTETRRPPLRADTETGRRGDAGSLTGLRDMDPFWTVPGLAPGTNQAETNTVAPPLGWPPLAILDTTNPIVTPQMLVPFFRLNSSGSNASGPSVIVPINLLPANPGLPPSSKARLNDQ